MLLRVCAREAAKFLTHTVSNPMDFTHVASNPVFGITNHKPTANSAVHPSEAGKCVLGDNFEDTSSTAVGPHQLHSCPFTQPVLTNRPCLLDCHCFVLSSFRWNAKVTKSAVDSWMVRILFSACKKSKASSDII